jgi:hypothetical protein
MRKYEATCAVIMFAIISLMVSLAVYDIHRMNVLQERELTKTFAVGLTDGSQYHGLKKVKPNDNTWFTTTNGEKIVFKSMTWVKEEGKVEQ